MVDGEGFSVPNGRRQFYVSTTGIVRRKGVCCALNYKVHCSNMTTCIPMGSKYSTQLTSPTHTGGCLHYYTMLIVASHVVCV